MSEYVKAPTGESSEDKKQILPSPSSSSLSSKVSDLKKKVTTSLKEKNPSSSLSSIATSTMKKGNMSKKKKKSDIDEFAAAHSYDQSLLFETNDPEKEKKQSSLDLSPNDIESQDEYKPPSIPQDQNDNKQIEQEQQNVEEKIRNECAFFYSDADDFEAKAHNTGYKNNIHTPDDSDNEKRGMSHHSHKLSLNTSSLQEGGVEEGGGMQYYAYSPSPPSKQTQSSQEPLQTNLTNSSLYQQRNDYNRVQIYLPTDNVRLLMDPQLESGILLMVKDGRNNSSDNSDNRSAYSLYSQVATQNPLYQQIHQKEQLDPPPSYVLTVDDDLYKRVVKEISHSSFPFGLYFCWSDSSEKVHIYVAIGILSVIFLLFFVSTMIWPYD